MSTAPAKLRPAVLFDIEHHLAIARAAEKLSPHSRQLPGGALSVEWTPSEPRVVYREFLKQFYHSCASLTPDEAAALSLAILSMPFGRLVSASPLTVWIPVKDTFPATFNSLLLALTTQKDVATLSQLLRSIAYDDACLGS